MVEEFKKLEVIEPHCIATMQITLENKREAALGCVDVLEVKFAAIGNPFSISMESVWSMCVLQRCHAMEHQYVLRSELLVGIFYILSV